MGVLKWGICIVLCLGICQTVPLFPKGQSWEYSYWATANIGTQKPAYAATGMKYHGKLTVESFSNKVIVMKLSEMESMYHNGGKQFLKGKGEPIAEEAMVLEKPFLVHYEDSKIDSIFVTPGEPIWAINMKKGVAGLFQLELERMDEAMYMEETNIYGKCSDVEYSVAKNKDLIEIMKLYKFDKCHGTSKMYTTSSEFKCNSEKSTISSAARNYILKKEQTHMVIKNISTVSERFVEGFFNEGAYKMISKQILELDVVSDLPEDHTIPDSCTVQKDLIYEHPQHFDMSHGRSPMTQDEIIHIIKQLTKKMAHRFEEKFVLDPNVLHQNSMQYMHWLMHSLNVEGFEKLYEQLSTGANCMLDMRKNIMFELLPQIGTYDSIMFMKKMLIKGEFEEYFTLKMMSVYPFYVKELSEKLLTEIDEFTNMPELFKNYNSFFKTTAYLSFANLISRTYQHGACSKEVFEKYVERFYKSFVESDVAAEKMVFVQVLRNLQYGSVFEKMMSIVADKSGKTHHLRFQAVFGLFADAPQHSAEMYKLFWPIFKNRTEHIEMRAFALKLLLLSEPTSARFFSIYWYMKSEPSIQLYNMYYSILNTLQYTSYPCYEAIFQNLAEKFMRYVKEPPKTRFEKITEVILTDYMNWDSGLASMFQGFIIGEDYSDLPNVGFFKTTTAGFNQIFDRSAVYLKVNGLSDFLDRDYEEGEGINKYSDILKMIRKSNLRIRPTQELHVEFFLEVQNKVIFSKQWDMQSLMNDYPVVKEHMENKMSECGNSFNIQYITPPMMTNYFDTTDFGTFTHIGFVKNWVTSMRSNDTSMDINQATLGRNADFRYGNMEFFEQRMDYFNPITNIYQGIVKMRTIHTGFAFNMTTSLNFQTHSPNFKFSNSNSNNGIVMHQQTVTYTARNDDILHETRSPAFSMKPLLKNPKAKMIKKDFEIPMKHLGIKVVLSIFDSDMSENYIELSKTVLDHVFELLDDEGDMDKFYQYYIKINDIVNYNVPEGKLGLALRIFPLFDEPSVLQFDFGQNLESWRPSMDMITEGGIIPPKAGVFLSGSLYPEAKPEDVYYWWNTTMDATGDKGLLTYFNLKYTDQSWKDQKPESMCFNYKLNYDSGDFPHPEADYVNLEPIKSSSLLFNLAWGKPKPEACPDEHSVSYKCKALISDEQIEAAKESKVWPFKECKEHLKGRKFNSATEACYLSAVEMSTYRKYENLIKVKNAPQWLTNLVTGVAMVSTFVPGMAEIEPEMEGDDIKLKFTEIVPMDEDEEDIKFIHNNTTQEVEIGLSTVLDVFNPKLSRANEIHLFDDFGTCVISSDVIRTFSNESLTKFDAKDKYIVLTQCVEKTAFVIFMNEMQTGGMKFHLATFHLNIDITPVENALEVVVNGEKLDMSKTTEMEHMSFRKIDDSTYYLHLTTLKIKMTIRPEFTVITAPEDDSCGLCNLHFSEYNDYVYSKHV